MFNRFIIIVIIAVFSTLAQAKEAALVTSLKAQTNKTWVQGKETVVRLKGQMAEESTQCQVFNITLDKSLRYKIDCAGHEKKASIVLENSSGLTVTRKGAHTTITKYNFLTKKPQTSRLKQSILKIPYVEEIIHLKTSEKGELSFYFESFRVDEFGRIVQDSFLQAHSLAPKEMKISAN